MIRTRRAPKAFEAVTVTEVSFPSSGFARVTLAGPAVAELGEPGLSSSIRVLVPASADEHLPFPTWQGNEFRHEDGSRPAIRTLTPLEIQVDRAVPAESSVSVMILRHGTSSAGDPGHLGRWLDTARVGCEAAISELGRAYSPLAGCTELWLLGDESALPAMRQITSSLAAVRIRSHLEYQHGDSPGLLPEAEVHRLRSADDRGTALLAALDGLPEPSGHISIWAAGEAAVMHRIRGAVAERGWPREQLWIRGYWK